MYAIFFRYKRNTIPFEAQPCLMIQLSMPRKFYKKHEKWWKNLMFNELNSNHIRVIVMATSIRLVVYDLLNYQ